VSENATTRSASAGGLVIAGFVFSIVALLLTIVGGGVIPGIVGVVLASIGSRRGRTSLGIAAIVIGVIAIVLSIVIVAVRVATTHSSGF
jgi:hypothetical protein